MLKMRDAVHLDLNGNRDLLLDLLRCSPRPLRNDLHPGIRDIWISFDRQAVKGDHSPNKEENRHAQDNEAAIQSEIDDGANHVIAAPPSFGIPARCPPPAGQASVRKEFLAFRREACRHPQLLSAGIDQL